MKRATYLWMFVALGFALVNCVGPENTIPEPYTPNGSNASGALKQKWQVALPREMDAMFVLGNTAYACTREDSLYDNKETDVPSYRLSAVDLVDGKQKWALSGSRCEFQIQGDSLYQVRDVANQPKLMIEKVDLASGKVQSSFEVEHGQCKNVHVVGSGEHMVLAQPNTKFPCFDFSIQEGRLVFVNGESAQMFATDSGKRVWHMKTDENVNRIVSVAIQQSKAYVLYASKELAKDSVAPGGSFAEFHAPDWKFQVRAMEWETGNSLWNAGPFPPPVLRAKLRVSGEQLFVQTLSSSLQAPSRIQDLLTHYQSSAWTGNVHLFALNKNDGKPVWKAPLAEITTKKNADSPPALSSLFLQKGTVFFQVPGRIHATSLSTGEKLWKEDTLSTQPTQIFPLAEAYIHLRSNQGKAGLLQLNGGTKVSFLHGDLMYNASPEMTSSDAPPAQPPKDLVKARGYCNRIDGSSQLMEEIKTETRFFLPPGRQYYGPRQFYNFFCVSYTVKLNAQAFGSSSQALSWSAQFTVPEAPVFFFMRNDTLFALSDNGDWYGFSFNK